MKFVGVQNFTPLQLCKITRKGEMPFPTYPTKVIGYYPPLPLCPFSDCINACPRSPPSTYREFFADFVSLLGLGFQKIVHLHRSRGRDLYNLTTEPRCCTPLYIFRSEMGSIFNPLLQNSCKLHKKRFRGCAELLYTPSKIFVREFCAMIHHCCYDFYRSK